MARTTGILTGSQYVKLVNIRLEHPTRTDLVCVRDLVTRGLVEIRDGRAVIADHERTDAALAEYDAWATIANARFLESLGYSR